MSQVLRAVDSKNAMARVAIKLFDRQAFQQNLVMEAFHRECESLQKLGSHPNIVTLLDIGRDRETACSYIALEWCDRNLLEHVREHPEPSWASFYSRYGRDILEALKFAYSQDIIHRDVKPQNVLVNGAGQACVTDFGISKFRRYYRPGVTLAHFKSIPYAPPEDGFDHPDTRDVFSFAVLCLECLGGKDFESYDDVYSGLESIDLPPEINSIFNRALARDPADRQANIVLLAEDIESAMRRSAAIAAITREIPVHLTTSAVEAMKAELGFATFNQAATQIIRDLNETCAVDELPNNQGEERLFGLLTAEFRFRALADRNRHALAIIGTSRQSPSFLDRQRERAWQPIIRFVPVNGNGDEEAIDWFTSEFDEFLTERKVVRSRQAETELFDEWASILRVKDALQNRDEAIRYSNPRADGARLRLIAHRPVEESVVGQLRLIRLDTYRAVSGEIERTDGEEIILYCGRGQDLNAVPPQGDLELDARLSQMAVRRQQAALDAVKFGRSVRPELRQFLLGKSSPQRPIPPADISFFQADLDDDKKDAVRAALGTSDLLVVEGPPGTGKTKFITELAAQVLSSSPDARILISSQTHVALDHALTNIERLAKKEKIPLRAVRLARPKDDRVSPELEHLLLEKCVKSWLNDATRRSEKFLIEWADARQISAQDVRAGMALADLRRGRVRSEDVNLRLKNAKREADDLLEQQRSLRSDKIRGDEYRALTMDIRLKQAEIDGLEEDKVQAKAALDAARARARAFPDLDGQVDALSTKDLADLEAAFVEHAPDGPAFRKLLTLAEEWRQRFGQSQDFHGAYVSDCDLIGGTCLGVAAPALQSVEFDLCIIDEASKASPTEMLVPMSKSKKWIIVGDPNQLPPYVDESQEAKAELARQELTTEDLKRTLLDHFIKIAPDENKVSLLTQHRMVKPIGDLVSACFYKWKLNNVNTATCPWLAKAMALPKPVTWLTTAALSDRHERRYKGSYVNSAELEAIGNLLLRLQLAASKRDKPYTVALLSGYGGQVGAFERLVTARQKQTPDLRIEFGTVDSYQGREADIAVYSVTRSNPKGAIGFLKEHQRLNVALSRGKVGLVIVGDSVFCREVKGQNPFGDVLSYIEQHKQDCCFVEVDHGS